MQARGYKVDSLFINAKKNFKLRISAARWDSIIKHPRRLFDKQETVEDAVFNQASVGISTAAQTPEMVHQSHRNVPNYSEQHCFF